MTVLRNKASVDDIPNSGQNNRDEPDSCRFANVGGVHKSMLIGPNYTIDTPS